MIKILKKLWVAVVGAFKKSEPPPVIVATSDFTPTKYKDHYWQLYSSMQIDPTKKSTVSWYIDQAKKGEERYRVVSELSSVPWQIIAALHALESGYNFDGVLHNGDRIIGKNRKTYRVPKGRGPFKTWEEAAVDALEIKQRPKEWNIVNALYFGERYNGLSYLWNKNGKMPNSPYIWGMTNHHTRGKFVRDGVYDPNAITKQLGFAVIIRELNFEGS